MDPNVRDSITLDQVASEPFRPNCQRCPRLVAHLDKVRAEMPEYHCAPVATWGNRRARVLIVGLAPGLHGANRTGRPFVGDTSGRLLFSVLATTGFADQTEASIRLRGCRITNAIRCHRRKIDPKVLSSHVVVRTWRMTLTPCGRGLLGPIAVLSRLVHSRSPACRDSSTFGSRLSMGPRLMSPTTFAYSRAITLAVLT